jgi:hypothetical protein
MHAYVEIQKQTQGTLFLIVQLSRQVGGGNTALAESMFRNNVPGKPQLLPGTNTEAFLQDHNLSFGNEWSTRMRPMKTSCSTPRPDNRPSKNAKSCSRPNKLEVSAIPQSPQERELGVV